MARWTNGQNRRGAENIPLSSKEDIGGLFERGVDPPQEAMDPVTHFINKDLGAAPIFTTVKHIHRIEDLAPITDRLSCGSLVRVVWDESSVGVVVEIAGSLATVVWSSPPRINPGAGRSIW